jgi:hypothetical protein
MAPGLGRASAKRLALAGCAIFWELQINSKRGVFLYMAEKPVLVGVIPEAVVIGPGDQVSWMAGEAMLKVEFDANRCPFASNMFQAPPGMRLLSGPPRPGTNPGSFKYKLWLNEQLVGSGEIILREK